jgi:hypothetical protein
MDLPDEVATKLSAYTLFCRQLLTRLPALSDVLRTDTRLTCDECCQCFDQSLHEFFQKASPRDLEQAVERLGDLLRGYEGFFKDRNPQAAAIFHQVIEAARTAAPTWRYQDDLETFHQQGRQLARAFYAGSPWLVTQARMDREARLVFLYDWEMESRDSDFGYHPVPLAFRERYPDEETGQSLEDVILVPFAFNRNFGLYLAYLYFFMHEYVAHIFALDSGKNELFNDGWLLYAADYFMKRLYAPPSEKRIEASTHQFDVYSCYETGLDQLRDRMKQDHLRYPKFCVYRQRLTENIGQSRRYGDTEARRAERSEIIDRLTELSLSVLGIPFTDLYRLNTSTTRREPPERLRIGFPLTREQTDVFVNHWYSKLRSPLPRGYSLAQDLQPCLPPERFDLINWELAAFEPWSREAEFWPTRLIIRMEQEFEHAPDSLIHKIESADDLRTLFEMLPPV